MHKKILSIIIPTYNMEKYLSRCVDSLISSVDKLEIVIVNDGSKDSSLAIAKDYQNKFPYSVIVIDKENGNYGSCINAALPIVKGKYVKVLDADDTFESKNLNDFLNLLRDIDVDLVITDYDIINQSGKKLKQISFGFKPDEILQFDESSCKKLANGELQMHACCYSTSIFKDLNYYQSEGISYTDQEWIYLPMSKIRSFYYYQRVIYQYGVGRNGQTMSKSQFTNSIKHELQGIEKMMKILNADNSHSIYQKEYLKERFITRLTGLYSKAIIQFYPSINLNLIEELDENIRKNSVDIFNKLNDLKYPRTGVRYVKNWRKHKRNRPYLWTQSKFHLVLIFINNLLKNIPYQQ